MSCLERNNLIRGNRDSTSLTINELFIKIDVWFDEFGGFHFFSSLTKTNFFIKINQT